MRGVREEESKERDGAVLAVVSLTCSGSHCISTTQSTQLCRYVLNDARISSDLLS